MEAATAGAEKSRRRGEAAHSCKLGPPAPDAELRVVAVLSERNGALADEALL